MKVPGLFELRRLGAVRFWLGIVLSVAAAVPVSRGSMLQNHSFEIDSANVGYPDGWDIPLSAQVDLVSDASDGSLSVKGSGGYNFLSQDLFNVPMAGRQMRLSVDVKGADIPKLGLSIGYYVTNSLGAKTWTYAQLAWNKSITSSWQRLDFTRTIPTSACPDRFWICFYRNGGTVFVDNVRLEIGSAFSTEIAKLRTIVRRELRYFRSRLVKAESAGLSPVLADALEVQANDFEQQIDSMVPESTNEAVLQDMLSSIEEMHGIMVSGVFSGGVPKIRIVHAYNRLAPDQFPDEVPAYPMVKSLLNEYQAFGVEVTNTSVDAENCTVSITPPAGWSVDVRRQHFIEDWYHKGTERLADILARLNPVSSGVWELNLKPGETARLFVEFRVPASATPGARPFDFQVANSSSQSASAAATCQVLGREFPAATDFAHVQFAYFWTGVTNWSHCYPDLVSHYVTDVQVASPPLPDTPERLVRFDNQGVMVYPTAANYNQAVGERYRHLVATLAGLTSHLQVPESWRENLRLTLFWQGKYPTLCPVEGTNPRVHLSPGTVPWQEGFTSYHGMVRDWAEQTHGIARSRWNILLEDEVHSSHLDDAPDQRVANFVALSTAVGVATPDLERLLTLTYYAFPADVEAMVGTVAEPVDAVDVFMPHWPYPTSLQRNAPATYNPALAFRDEIWPLLEEQRKLRSKKIWSYRVSPGRSESILRCRSYPVFAARHGMTGVGWWAYNIMQGSNWDDTDGSMLDYAFIYNGGSENNLTLNPTGEVVVPSIRWQTVRMGMQDAILLHELKKRRDGGTLTPVQLASLADILNDLENNTDAYGFESPLLEMDLLDEVGDALRELWSTISH